MYSRPQFDGPYYKVVPDAFTTLTGLCVMARVKFGTGKSGVCSRGRTAKPNWAIPISANNLGAQCDFSPGQFDVLVNLIPDAGDRGAVHTTMHFMPCAPSSRSNRHYNCRAHGPPRHFSARLRVVVRLPLEAEIIWVGRWVATIPRSEK
jgi:hypothetical protein